MNDETTEKMSQAVALMIARSREKAGCPIPDGETLTDAARRMDPANQFKELIVHVGDALGVPELPRLALTSKTAHGVSLPVIAVGGRGFRGVLLDQSPSLYWCSEDVMNVQKGGSDDDFDVRDLPETCWAGVSEESDDPFSPSLDVFRNAPVLYAAVFAGHL